MAPGPLTSNFVVDLQEETGDKPIAVKSTVVSMQKEVGMSEASNLLTTPYQTPPHSCSAIAISIDPTLCQICCF